MYNPKYDLHWRSSKPEKIDLSEEGNPAQRRCRLSRATITGWSFLGPEVRFFSFFKNISIAAWSYLTIILIQQFLLWWCFKVLERPAWFWGSSMAPSVSRTCQQLRTPTGRWSPRRRQTLRLQCARSTSRTPPAATSSQPCRDSLYQKVNFLANFL